MKEMLSGVSPKGQVTPPVEIRRVLGIKPKDQVAFHLEKGKVELTPAPSPLQDSYQALPALKPARSWKEIEAVVAEEIARDAAREGYE
jgi:AbrB family looped-hinge helix DNA binding protein